MLHAPLRPATGSRDSDSRPPRSGGRSHDVDIRTSPQRVRHVTDLFGRLDEVSQFHRIRAGGVNRDVQRAETPARVIPHHVHAQVAQRNRTFRSAVHQRQSEAGSQRREQEIGRLRGCPGATGGLRLVHRNGERPRPDLTPQRSRLPRGTHTSGIQLNNSLCLHDGSRSRARPCPGGIPHCQLVRHRRRLLPRRARNKLRRCTAFAGYLHYGRYSYPMLPEAAQRRPGMRREETGLGRRHRWNRWEDSTTAPSERALFATARRSVRGISGIDPQDRAEDDGADDHGADEVGEVSRSFGELSRRRRGCAYLSGGPDSSA